MTRRESRGCLIFTITIISLITGVILTIAQSHSWHGPVLLLTGIVGSYLCYKRWQIFSKATNEEKKEIERQDEDTRSSITAILIVLFVIVAFLEVVAVCVGFILNISIGGELGNAIIHYAVIVGGVVAAIFLGFLLFFA